MAQKPGPDPTVRSTDKRFMYGDNAPAPFDLSSVANGEQHYTAATYEHDAEDPCHHSAATRRCQVGRHQ